MYPIIYLLLMMLIAFLLGRNRKQIGIDGAYTGIMVGFFINYALVPFILQSNADFYKQQTWWSYWYINKLVFGSGITDANIILSIICTIIGIIGFTFGYNTKIKFREKKIYNTENEYATVNESTSSVSKTVFRVAIVVFIICSIMLLLYISAFGGLNRALSMANTLRSHTVGVSNYGISSAFSYVFLICGFLPLSFCFFWYVFINEKNVFHLIILIFSGIMTFIYLRLNSGKSGFIRFGIILAYILIGKKARKRFWVYILIGGIISLPILDLLDTWFSGETIIQAANHADIRSNVVAFESAIELNYNLREITEKYGYQFFRHYIIDFLDILPGLSFKTSWESVSEFVRGSDWATKGGTPNDIITYGYLQLNVIGVFIHLFVTGQFARWVDRSLVKLPDANLTILLSIAFCSNFISFVSCSDISSTFLHNLFFTGLIIFLIYINRKLNKPLSAS